jgi:hypothetical protein
VNDQTASRRIAAISAIISAPLALAADVIVTVAVEFDFELMSDQARLITLGARAAEILRWGEILGIFGYYLLLAPVALYLWYWLRPHNPRLVTMYTVSGLASIFIGVIGAGLRAGVLPEMMSAYAQAPDAQRQVLSIVFQTVTNVIFVALGPVEGILAGLWLLGIGLVLRSERRGLGIFAVILGIAMLGSGFGAMFQIELLAMLQLVYFVSPIWALWLGIVIWRHAENEKSEQSLEPAPAT